MIKMINTTDKDLTRPDIRIIQMHHNLGKYFGLTPISCGNPRRRILKWYVPLLLLLFLILSIHTVLVRTVLYRSKLSLLEKVLDGAHCLSNLAYIGLSLFATQFRHRNWNDIFNNIETTEKRFPKGEFNVDKSTCLFKVEVTVYHLIFLMVHLSQAVYWVFTDKIANTYIFISLRVATYFEFFDVILICTLNQMLRRRYKHLSRVVHNILRRTNLSFRNIEDKQSVLKLKDVFVVYQMLNETVNCMNTIFGWKIYLILQCMVLSVLNSFCFVLTNSEPNNIAKNLERFMYTVAFSTLLISVTICLVMSCDGVQKSGRELTNACYLKLICLDKSVLREELMLLAKCTKDLAPRISLAGFFTVNQVLLVSMFSSIITYLIIIIQFNLVS